MGMVKMVWRALQTGVQDYSVFAGFTIAAFVFAIVVINDSLGILMSIDMHLATIVVSIVAICAGKLAAENRLDSWFGNQLLVAFFYSNIVSGVLLGNVYMHQPFKLGQVTLAVAIFVSIGDIWALYRMWHVPGRRRFTRPRMTAI